MSFAESFARGFQLGLLLKEYKKKETDKKKASSIFKELSKNENLASNPAAFWRAYTDRLVGEGIMKPDEAIRLQKQGVEMHTGFMQLQRLQSVDQVMKSTEELLRKAQRYFKQGKTKEYRKIVERFVNAYDAVPDNISIRLEEKDGRLYAAAYSEITGDRLKQRYEVTPEFLQQAAPALAHQTIAMKDPLVMASRLSAQAQSNQTAAERQAIAKVEQQKSLADYKKAMMEKSVDLAGDVIGQVIKSFESFGLEMQPEQMTANVMKHPLVDGALQMLSQMGVPLGREWQRRLAAAAAAAGGDDGNKGGGSGIVGKIASQLGRMFRARNRNESGTQRGAAGISGLGEFGPPPEESPEKRPAQSPMQFDFNLPTGAIQGAIQGASELGSQALGAAREAFTANSSTAVGPGAAATTTEQGAAALSGGLGGALAPAAPPSVTEQSGVRVFKVPTQRDLPNEPLPDNTLSSPSAALVPGDLNTLPPELQALFGLRAVT